MRNGHLLVRAFRDRNIENDHEGEAVKTSVSQSVYASPVLATKMLHVRARPAAVPQASGKRDKARTTRDAFLEIRKSTVVVKSPKHLIVKHESAT